MTTRHIHWSDHDHRFGPFTYARERRYRQFGAVITSGKGEDDDGWQNGCYIRFHAFRHSLLIGLPQIIKPARRWVDTSRHTWASERGGYWEVWPRDFGIIFTDGAVHVHRGQRTHDSTTDRTKVYFLPWRSWRHIRRSFYDLEGRHVATLPQMKGGYLENPHRWEVERAIEAVCPTASFDFADFDGERLSAVTKIDEREWRLGEGRFKWLSLFAPRKVHRSLDIRFSGETGRRKGSWKGGTVGHSIEMLPGELHEASFQRYCAENSMTFVGRAASVDTRPEGGDAKQAPFTSGAVAKPDAQTSRPNIKD
jgi:hypothetical protein